MRMNIQKRVELLEKKFNISKYRINCQVWCLDENKNKKLLSSYSVIPEKPINKDIIVHLNYAIESNETGVVG